MSLDWIDAELARLESANLLRQLVARDGPQTTDIVVEGGKYVNFGSNDYLGLASHPDIAASVQQLTAEQGCGSGSSALILGRHRLHQQLEQSLAEFLQCEAALLFPTGFAANVGTIPALVGRDDVILSDAKNHASIIDGCRLSGATIRIFPHLDLDAAAQLLGDAASYRRRLIVSDSVFSMDGDVARIDELVALAERHDAMVMIDEAHALGVLGADGGGVCSDQGVSQQVDVRVGTLSKAFGSHGGFVVGSDKLVRYLANRARAYIFSTAGPVASAAAGLAALRHIQRHPESRIRLRRKAERLRLGLEQQGWNVPAVGTHILPVMIGAAERAVELSEGLRQRGFWVPCIRPPSVPDGESLLRISISDQHTERDVDNLLQAFRVAKPA